MLSEQERAFVRTQPLARLATVAVSGQPDADAIGFVPLKVLMIGVCFEVEALQADDNALM